MCFITFNTRVTLGSHKLTQHPRRGTSKFSKKTLISRHVLSILVYFSSSSSPREHRTQNRASNFTSLAQEKVLTRGMIIFLLLPSDSYKPSVFSLRISFSSPSDLDYQESMVLRPSKLPNTLIEGMISWTFLQYQLGPQLGFCFRFQRPLIAMSATAAIQANKTCGSISSRSILVSYLKS